MTTNERRDPSVILRDGDAIDRAFAEAYRQTVLRHRALRVPLVFWRDGKVVEVDPESVALPEPGSPRP
jgi:hypothetical protein